MAAIPRNSISFKAAAAALYLASDDSGFVIALDIKTTNPRSSNSKVLGRKPSREM
jgi:hypothetical protein